MAKTIQITAVPAHERKPPLIFALRDDGSIWAYKPEVYISYGHNQTVIDNDGWAKIPDIPE